MKTVVHLIDEALRKHDDEEALEGIAERVNEMMSHRPLFAW